MKEREVINHLRSALELDEKQAKVLFNGLADALAYHDSMKGFYCSEITLKDYRNQIEAAYDAARKLNIALNQIPEKDREGLDSYYYDANAQDLMLALSNRHLSKLETFRSGFEIVAEGIEKALKLAEININTPGAGNARRTGREYIAAIEMLARWFSDACPSHKPSATPNTPFYKYVQIWFQCHIDPNNHDKDVRRHITNTLKHPNVRLKHV